MTEPEDVPEPRPGIAHFSIRGLLAAMALFALLIAAENDERGPWGDLLFCIALGGLAFQSVWAWSSRPGPARLPPLTSAVFGWFSILGIPLVADREPNGFLAFTFGYPFAVIVFLVAGTRAGRILARWMAHDGSTA